VSATNVGCPWSGTVPPVCLLRKRAWFGVREFIAPRSARVQVTNSVRDIWL
jgi:hypothetical protein